VQNIKECPERTIKKPCQLDLGSSTASRAHYPHPSVGPGNLAKFCTLYKNCDEHTTPEKRVLGNKVNGSVAMMLVFPCTLSPCGGNTRTLIAVILEKA